jgi:hypothetical protein
MISCFPVSVNDFAKKTLLFLMYFYSRGVSNMEHFLPKKGRRKISPPAFGFVLFD